MENYKAPVRLAASDVKRVVTMFAAALGEGYITPEVVRAAMDDGLAMLCESNDGQVVGATISQKMLPADKWQSLTQEEAKSAGYLADVVVLPEHRRRGVGSALVRATLHALVRKNRPFVVAHAWLESPAPIHQILERFGFVQRAVLANHWYDDSLKRGFVCPRCGLPCLCSALVYVRIDEG